MSETQRFIKKLTIVLIIAFVVFAISWPNIRPKDDPCYNGNLDLGEDEIDCGGLCEKKCPPPEKPPMVNDIKIEWSKAIKDSNGKYDLVAKLYNTNKHWGAVSVDYKFSLYDEKNQIIDKINGKTYIVPLGYSDGKGIKYVIENNYLHSGTITKVDFELSNFVWSEVIEILELPELGVDTIIVKDRNHGKLETGSGYYYAYGVTKNTSKYSFRKVDIYTVIYDAENIPIAAGKTDQWTVGAGEGWEFRIFWNEKFDSEAKEADFVAETNIFEQSNFMKSYGTGKKYYSK